MFIVWHQETILAIAALAPFSVFADDLNFYRSDVAKTVFSSEATVRVAGFSEGGKPKVGGEQKNETQPAVPHESVETNLLSSDELKKQKEQEIIAKYGDPDSRPKARTVDNAPPEFKCMIEAMDSGLDELAYRCAKKWKSGMANLAKNTNRVTSLMQEIDREQNLAEEKGINTDDKSLAARVALERANDALGKLNSETKFSRSEVFKAITADGSNRITREGLRAALINAGNVPVDAQGKVNVIFFFDPTDVQSDRMAKQMEALKRATSNDIGVEIVGITTQRPIQGALEDFKTRNQVTFVAAVKPELASRFGIERAPATILVSPTLNQAIVEDGVRPFEYLDEVVRVMRGGR